MPVAETNGSVAARATAGSRVRLDAICKTFHTRQGALPVLDNMSFTAEPGSFVAILGPSGSGKSTTLGVVCGLYAADSGTLEAPDPTKTGYVFQTPRLLPWRDVESNLEIARDARERQTGTPFRRDVDHYLELARLGDFKSFYPLALSGGMQQRVSIARALSVEPSVLLMDEPFSSLDELTAREQRSYLLDLWAEAKPTVLFVTHNVLEAITLATSIVVVSKRPATVMEEIPVDLPYPRSAESPEAIALQRRILALLGVTDPGALA